MGGSLAPDPHVALHVCRIVHRSNAANGGRGVPRSKETAPPQDPPVGLCLGPYGGPRGGGVVSDERGTPVVCVTSLVIPADSSSSLNGGDTCWLRERTWV